MQPPRMLSSERRPHVLAIGGAAVDHIFRIVGDTVPGTSNPSVSHVGFGGVARNVAEILARLGVAVDLVTVVGKDDAGRALRENLNAHGIGDRAVTALAGRRTATYCAVVDCQGDLVLGLADMDIFGAMGAAFLTASDAAIAGADWVYCDCNLPADGLAVALSRAADHGTPVAVDLVSVSKASRLPQDLSAIALLVCNLDEAAAVVGDAGSDPAALANALHRRGAGLVAITRGADGVLVTDGATIVELPAATARPVDVTGAGDAFFATMLAGLMAGLDPVDAARRGTVAAAVTVEWEGSVYRELTSALLTVEAERRLPAES